MKRFMIMSDYYGQATLEDWLIEEVFQEYISKEEVSLFEKWREPIEQNIIAWMETDDGDGNNLSWRGWGRGYFAIQEDEEKEFDNLVSKIIESRRMTAENAIPPSNRNKEMNYEKIIILKANSNFTDLIEELKGATPESLYYLGEYMFALGHSFEDYLKITTYSF